MKTSSLILPSGTPKEEVANFYTHLSGFFLALIGGPLLVFRAANEGYAVFGYLVFAAAAVLLYASSTLYHGIQRPKLKFLLQKLDHICIYYLIAGTHTPFAILYLDGEFGRNYLIGLWALVLIGTFYKIFFFGKWKIFSTVFYLSLGWMAIFTMPAMLELMPMTCFYWILIGAVSYTIGVLFYAKEEWPYNHAIWHILVIGGTFGHYMAAWNTIP